MSIQKDIAAKEPFTIEEEDLFERGKEKLYDLIREYFENFRTQFPQDTAEVLALLIDIWNMLHASKAEAEQSMIQVIENSIKINFQALKRKTFKKTYKSMSNHLTDQQLLELVDLVEGEVKDLSSYANFFPKSVNLISISVSTFLSLIRDEVQEYCSDIELSVNVFDLLGKLKDLQKYFQSISEEFEPQLIPLNQMFEPFALAWMKEAQTRLIRWIRENNQDKNNTKGDTLHSVMVDDFFDALWQTYQFITVNDLLNPFLLMQTAEVISNTVDYFLSDQIFSESEVPKDESQNSKFDIEPVLCVQLNNVECTGEKTEEILVSIKEEFNNMEPSAQKENISFSLSFSIEQTSERTKKILEKDISFVSAKYSRYIKSQLMKVFQNISDEKLPQNEIEELCNYLDDQFALLSDNLYDILWKKILENIWMNLNSVFFFFFLLDSINLTMD